MKQSFNLNDMQPVIRITTHGDLTISARNQPYLEIETDGVSPLECSQQGEVWVVNGNGDLKINLPPQSHLEIERVDGEASIDGIENELQLHQASGGVQLAHCGPILAQELFGDFFADQVNGAVSVKKVGGCCRIQKVQGNVEVGWVGGDLQVDESQDVQVGDLSADGEFRKIRGNLTGQRVGGDVKVQEVQGNFRIENIGGDLDTDEVRGTIQATAGGCVRIQILSTAQGDSHIQGGGDIDCQISGQVNAVIDVSSGGGDVCMRSDHGTAWMQTGTHQIVLGEGKDHIELYAGGDVFLNVEGQVTTSERKTERSWDDTFSDLADRINQQVMATQIEPAFTERLEGVVKKVTEKLNERFASSTVKVKVDTPSSTSAQDAPPAAPTVEPAGEDERLMVLRMVQEKKLSIEEAESLLEALDGAGETKNNG